MRTLHLVDVENLCGCPQPSESLVRATLERYRRSMGVRDVDHAVVAAASRTAFFVGLAWPGARVRVGRGPDGADRAILDSTDVRHIAKSYSWVVIASGDHIFAPLVKSLQGPGLDVEVVAPTRGIAQDLRRAAAPLRHFDVLYDAETLGLAS